MNTSALLSATRRQAAVHTLTALIRATTGLNHVQSGALAQHMIQSRLVTLHDGKAHFGNPKYRQAFFMMREWHDLQRGKIQ